MTTTKGGNYTVIYGILTDLLDNKFLIYHRCAESGEITPSVASPQKGGHAKMVDRCGRRGSKLNFS